MIEIIARALIVNDGKLLLCKALKGENCHYLPGGHVEFGESAEAALKREMIEESNSQVDNLRFIGIFENKWGEGKIHHEYNLIYAVDIADLNVISIEEHIAFEWVAFADLDKLTFYPREFLLEIQKWCLDPKGIYLSTMH